MTRSCFRKRRLLLPVIAALGLGSAAISAEPSNKWRIEFNESAQADGIIMFSITPAGAAPTRVVANIPGGATENDIAELVSNSFKTTLDAGYKVEVDDGEHVLIKKSDGTPDFDLRLVSSSVTGLKIDLQRE